MDRRSFVKTCVGVAGAGALAASGLAMAAGMAIPRAPGGSVLPYYGAHRVGGPAPRGVPYIPITVENGVFVGKTVIPPMPGSDGATDTNVLDWYKYCGHAGAPGLQPGFTEDNTLTYFIAEEKLKSITPWFKDLLGQPVRPEDFPADGFGASFIWRSQGQSGPNVLTGVIIKAPARELELVSSVVPPARPLGGEEEFQFIRENVFHENFVGVSTFCTHFCCIPGYRENEALARPRDAWDNMFCTCHNSNYNHRQPVRYTFSPEVVGDVGGGGFDPLLKRGGGGGGH